MGREDAHREAELMACATFYRRSFACASAEKEIDETPGGVSPSGNALGIRVAGL
jgi:hypothetical protein